MAQADELTERAAKCFLTSAGTRCVRRRPGLINLRAEDGRRFRRWSFASADGSLPLTAHLAGALQDDKAPGKKQTPQDNKQVARIKSLLGECICD